MNKKIKLSGEHWRITSVSLNAFTDAIDTPVHRNEYFLFDGEVEEDISGNIFFLENLLDLNAFVIIVDNPDYERVYLKVSEYTATVEAESNTMVIPCNMGECESVCRNAIKSTMRNRPLVAMSNTWGDGNGFSKVNEQFVLREINKAQEIGLDIVQIDDGWQTGSTADPKRRDENGVRFFADDFWVLNEERFPHGMKYVSDYAAERGVKLGLWFAPESKNHFELAKRDIKILKNAYDNWGIRYFKLDMYRIEDNEDKIKFADYLKAISSFGDDVEIQLDVTLDNRVNYLFGREYGSVFVENRYTEATTYFPHRTLKNLWMLSAYVPAQHLQLELVNPVLNQDKYSENDAFAPAKYDIEYLFASVMLSNPLFWMELQNLTEENTKRLERVVSVWKKYRNTFSQSDIIPIGERPCGRSFTGFYIKNETDNQEFALVFREVTKEAQGKFNIPCALLNAEVVLSNGEICTAVKDSVLSVEFSSPRTFALIRLY